MGRSFAETIVSRRVGVVLLLAAAGAALLPLAPRAEDALDVSGRIRGSESAAVEEVLATRFESPFARSAVAVLSGVPSPDTPAGGEALADLVATLGEIDGVTGTWSHLDQADSFFVGSGGGTFVIVGLDPQASPDALVARLREEGLVVATRLGQRFPGAALRWTGEPVLNIDFRRASAEEVRAAEARALPLTALLLLVAFGSLVATALPLVAGSLAVGFTLGAAVLLTRWWPLATTLQVVASMLGLGLGIDYALLTVSRFRESRVGGRGAEDAAADACRHAGGTVALSGAAVAIGFAGLMLVPVSELRSLALGGLLVVGASVLIAVTLLPALLAWLGPRIDRGRLPWRRSGDPSTRAAEAWRSWGRWVWRHPILVLLVAGTPLLFLTAQAPRMRTGMPDGDWLPTSMDSTAAVRDLKAMGRSGLVQEVRVVIHLPEEAFALGAEGWQALRRAEETLAADPRVARVQSLSGVAGDRADDLAYVSFLPGFLKHCFISGEGDAGLLSLVPREGVSPAAMAGLVRELRRADPAALTGLDGARLQVGGLPAFNVDYDDAVAGRFGGVVAVVIGATLLALFFAFRSVLIPLKAVALNLLSVGAAFGALVLVFQDGHGASWVGLTGATGSVFPAVPILAFAIVFGLSMDYEVFLMTRVAEAGRSGLDEGEAVAEGLARTGRVITSAAAVMVAVFGAFAAGGFLLVKMLGFALGVAVLLDATLIRVAVGPALLRLGGRWNWWPGAGVSAGRAGRHREAGKSPGEDEETIGVTARAGADF
jgi:RND superfamily putative drug exporter